LQCIIDCKSSTKCILEKCGREALDCFDGKDQLCHDALTCAPKQLMACSQSTYHCVFDRSTVCHDNLMCLASGAEASADPVVNLFTDTSIAGLMTCANQKCPAPERPHVMKELVSPNGLNRALSPQWPGQLECMDRKCGFKVLDVLLKDKDVRNFAACTLPKYQTCGNTLWTCLGDDKCKASVSCWLSGIQDENSDVWKMLTSPSERAFLELLYSCVDECAHEPDGLKKALCVSKCGLKATKCRDDSACRGAFGTLPRVALKCGIESLNAPIFREMSSCYGSMLADCGRAAIELVRDTELADLVTCNHQCTRPPTHHHLEEARLIV